MPTTIHPEKYNRRTESAQWICEKGQYLWKTETIFMEYDAVLNDWVKVHTDVKTETPQEIGYLKTIDFIIVFPDDSAPAKAFGKGSVKTPKLLLQVGVVSVRPENANTWLLKQYQPAIDREGATGKWSIYIKTLSGTGITYRFGYVPDDNVACSIGEERETTMTELNQLEEKGILIFYHGKASFSESEGFTYADVAMRKTL